MRHGKAIFAGLMAMVLTVGGGAAVASNMASISSQLQSGSSSSTTTMNDLLSQANNTGALGGFDSSGSVSGAPSAVNPAMTSCVAGGGTWNSTTSSCTPNYAAMCINIGGTYANGQCTMPTAPASTGPANAFGWIPNSRATFNINNTSGTFTVSGDGQTLIYQFCGTGGCGTKYYAIGGTSLVSGFQGPYPYNYAGAFQVSPASLDLQCGDPYAQGSCVGAYGTFGWHW